MVPLFYLSVPTPQTRFFDYQPKFIFCMHGFQNRLIYLL